MLSCTQILLILQSHPVRNKPRKKKPKSILKQTAADTKPRLKGSDFQAWDKYDVVGIILTIILQRLDAILSRLDQVHGWLGTHG
jgi:hypothetical protein